MRLTRLAFPVIAIAFGACVQASAAPPLAVVFKNQSGLPDAKVLCRLRRRRRQRACGDQRRERPADPAQPLQDEHWYTLKSLRSGISMTRFTGGRIYVGYGAPWTF